jgi:hypothetical protein
MTLSSPTQCTGSSMDIIASNILIKTGLGSTSTTITCLASNITSKCKNHINLQLKWTPLMSLFARVETKSLSSSTTELLLLLLLCKKSHLMRLVSRTLHWRRSFYLPQTLVICRPQTRRNLTATSIRWYTHTRCSWLCKTSIYPKHTSRRYSSQASLRMLLCFQLLPRSCWEH